MYQESIKCQQTLSHVRRLVARNLPTTSSLQKSSLLLFTLSTSCQQLLIIQAQRANEESIATRRYRLEGWPAYMAYNSLLRPYWEAKAHLSTVDHLLLYDDRLVIPRNTRLKIQVILASPNIAQEQVNQYSCQDYQLL